MSTFPHSRTQFNTNNNKKKEYKRLANLWEGTKDMELLRHLREKMSVTQGYVAESVGISRSTYALYETGAREPNLDALCSLADFFHVSTDYLLGRTTNINEEIKKLDELRRGSIHRVDLSLMEFIIKFDGLKKDNVFFIVLVNFIVGVIKHYTNVVETIYKGKAINKNANMLMSYVSGLLTEIISVAETPSGIEALLPIKWR